MAAIPSGWPLAELDGAGPDQDFRALYDRIEAAWQEDDPNSAA